MEAGSTVRELLCLIYEYLGLTNSGNFQWLAFPYWSGVEYAPDPSHVWSFATYDGSQGFSNKSNLGQSAVAVHPGDVAAVIPEPQTCALMLMGLGALVLAMRRRPR